MKVLTKYVVIGNQEFVLIKDEHEGQTYYGTIPYSDIDSKGCLARKLNGFDMCISFESVAEAIDLRQNRIIIQRYSENHTEDEVMVFIANGCSEECMKVKGVKNNV